MRINSRALLCFCVLVIDSDLSIFVNRLIDESEILLTVAFLFELAVLINGGLSELELCVGLGSCVEGDAKILTDEAYLEAIGVISARGHVVDHAWSRIVGIDAPAAAS